MIWKLSDLMEQALRQTNVRSVLAIFRNASYIILNPEHTQINCLDGWVNVWVRHIGSAFVYCIVGSEENQELRRG